MLILIMLGRNIKYDTFPSSMNNFLVINFMVDLYVIYKMIYRVRILLPQIDFFLRLFDLHLRSSWPKIGPKMDIGSLLDESSPPSLPRATLSWYRRRHVSEHARDCAGVTLIEGYDRDRQSYTSAAWN